MTGSLKVGDDFEGVYKIIAVIGQGGFGTVYLATHKYMTTFDAHGKQQPLQFAIKELNHPDQSYIDRFMSEAGILVQMSGVAGANVTKIVNLVEHKKHYFLIMEYVLGGTLADVGQRQVSEHQLAVIFIEIAKGLEVMHGNKPQVVHRDMKPENVKVRFEGPSIFVKILDWGVAAIQGFSPAGEVVGTPSFAGPAQMRGEVASPFMDQHSFGATLYYMMMDCHTDAMQRYLPFPFVSWNTASQAKAALDEFSNGFQKIVDQVMKPRPAQWDPYEQARQKLAATGYSQQLQDIVLKTVAPNDNEKYRSMTAVRQELERLIGGGRPISPTTHTSPPAPPTSGLGRTTNSTPPPPPRTPTGGAFLPIGKPKAKP